MALNQTPNRALNSRALDEALRRLRWHGPQLVSGLGLPGWLGVGLVLASVALWITNYLPARDEAVRLTREAGSLARQGTGADSASGHVNAAAQLVRFQRRFPEPRQLAANVGKIKAAAARNGIVLAQGEFQWIKDGEGGLSRYQMVLPVKAAYRNTRSFMREVLRDLPGCALDEVNFRRDDAKSGLLDTRLRLTLYVSDPS
jgi:hypothetical protein